MIKTARDFFADAERFITLFDKFAQKHCLKGRAQADHLCYKCGSRESFERLRTLFETESEYIYQSIISKRPIAYIKCKTGIATSLGTIHFLELSDQKPDGSQQDGFDHIEAYPVGWSYDDMVRELEKTERVVKVERPHHTTHDVEIGEGEGFLFRCTRGPLLEKIKDGEMI